MSLEVHARFAACFAQKFLTKFTASFFRRQTELLECQRKCDAETITENDHQVVYYICGYILHALKKEIL